MPFTVQRDPALWASLAASSVRLISAFAMNLSIDQQSLVNAAAAAVAGSVVAMIVHDGQQAALLGAIQALLALGVGFGLQIEAAQQAVIMSFVGTAIAMFIRTQVTAPVPPAD